MAAAALYVFLLGLPWYVAAIGLIAAGILTSRRVTDPVSQLAIAMFTSLAGSSCLAEAVLHGLHDYFHNDTVVWLSVELILLAIPATVMSFGMLSLARIAVSAGLLVVAGALAVLVLATTGIDRMIADPLIRANLVSTALASTDPSYWDHRIRTDVFSSIAPAPAIILYWVFWLATLGRACLSRRSLAVLGGAVLGAATVALTAWLLWPWLTYAPSALPSPVLTLLAALVLAIWRILVLIGRRFPEMVPIDRPAATIGG